MSIQTRSMLVDLLIRKWDATKYDKRVSLETEQKHGAHDAGRYNKQLIDKVHLADLSSLAGQARQFHYSRTLAWSDKGLRLLPSELFLDYRQEIASLKTKYLAARDAFIKIYPQLVQDARNRLGTMYDPMDYPPVDKLHDAFDIQIEFMPVPDAGDFRVDIGNEERAEIQQQITDALNARMTDAIRECYARTREVVKKISEQCGDKKRRFFDSTIDNARDLVDVLKGLNITNDPQIQAMEAELRNLLVSPDAIRANPVTRQRVADDADALLAKLPWA